MPESSHSKDQTISELEGHPLPEEHDAVPLQPRPQTQPTQPTQPTQDTNGPLFSNTAPLRSHSASIATQAQSSTFTPSIISSFGPIQPQTQNQNQDSPSATTVTAPRLTRPRPKLYTTDTHPGVIAGGEVDEHPTDIIFTKLAQKDASPWDHLSLTLGGPAIILFDIVVPCIIYYSWYNANNKNWKADCAPYWANNQICPFEKPEHNGDIMGYAVISFGFGEIYILIARVLRLFYHRDECAPLLSRSKYELDATSWVYLTAMVCALIPFVISADKEIEKLYLYSPSFIMGFLGILMVMTLIPFPLPIGINSHARGTSIRPFIYYAAEDFIAVDALQDREFRIRYSKRYDASPRFRRMFLFLTLWWICGVCVYIGMVSVVIFTLPFHIAFGLSLGVLFSYIAIWAITSYIFVNVSIHREQEYEKAAILRAREGRGGNARASTDIHLSFHS